MSEEVIRYGAGGVPYYEQTSDIEKEQKEYNLIYNDPEARSTVDAERMVVWGQELSWERSIIYKCQKKMDTYEEEDV